MKCSIAATAPTRSRSPNRRRASGPTAGAELDLELAGARMDGDGEPAVTEHVDHRVVLGHDDRRQRVDALRRRTLGHGAEQHGADTAAVPGLGHLERHLGAPRPVAHVQRVTDDVLGVPGERDDARGGRRERGGLPQVRPAGEEPQQARALRQAVEHRAQLRLVLRVDGADPDRGAVGEDGVGGELRRRRRHGPRPARRRSRPERRPRRRARG